MLIIDTHNVFTYVCTEQEWYGADEYTRGTMAEACLAAAETAGRRYAAILVEPDAVMSISPERKRHKVWGHTFPSDPEKQLRRALAEVCGDAMRDGLTIAQIAAVLKAHIEDKLK